MIISPQVFHEVIEIGKLKGKPDAFVIDRKLNAKVLTIHEGKESPLSLNLGPGETEIIQIALEEMVPALIDDKKARNIGNLLGLKAFDLPLLFLEALMRNIWDIEKFDQILDRWSILSSPSQDQIFFIRNIAKLIKQPKKKLKS